MKAAQIIEKKILTLEQLIKKRHIWRFKNQQVVFTNGCFDLLHGGHIDLLLQAADLGQKLILGLNSDTSVKALKGDKRPIQNQQTRATILAALGCIDAVIIFGESTPFQLIEALLPDVLVKGGDYNKSQIVGADIVEKNGGKVVIIPYIQGVSTTNIVEKIKAEN